MWGRTVMLGTGMAVGGLMLIPGAATAAMQGARTAMALGVAANRMVSRQMLRATAEALEVVEDLVAEVRADLEARSGAAPEKSHVVIPGRAAAEAGADARAVALQPADLARIHVVGRRLRLRFRGALADGEMDRVATEIAAFPGVARLRLKPLTRCLVIETDGPAEQLAEALERTGVARLAEAGYPHPAALATSIALGWLDQELRRRTRGKQSLRSVIAMVVEAGLAIRARRGTGPTP